MRARCHTEYGIKMTMHIDEELLDRVVESYGFTSKTEAVEMALREMDRKMRFRAVVREGFGMTPDELAKGVDPDYDVLASRIGEKSETCKAKRGRKRSGR